MLGDQRGHLLRLHAEGQPAQPPVQQHRRQRAEGRARRPRTPRPAGRPPGRGDLGGRDADADRPDHRSADPAGPARTPGPWPGPRRPACRRCSTISSDPASGIDGIGGHHPAQRVGLRVRQPDAAVVGHHHEQRAGADPDRLGVVAAPGRRPARRRFPGPPGRPPSSPRPAPGPRPMVATERATARARCSYPRTAALQQEAEQPEPEQDDRADHRELPAAGAGW